MQHLQTPWVTEEKVAALEKVSLSGCTHLYDHFIDVTFVVCENYSYVACIWLSKFCGMALQFSFIVYEDLSFIGYDDLITCYYYSETKIVISKLPHFKFNFKIENTFSRLMLFIKLL